jgi:hypothetical protein
LIGLRADLASGDERFVYLAWLLDVQCGEIDDNAIEPARPEGLDARRGSARNRPPVFDTWLTWRSENVRRGSVLTRSSGPSGQQITVPR